MIRLRSVLRIIAMLSATMLVIVIAVDASPHSISSVQIRGSGDAHEFLREKRVEHSLFKIKVQKLEDALVKVGTTPITPHLQGETTILRSALSEIDRWISALEPTSQLTSVQAKNAEAIITDALNVLSRTKHLYRIPGWVKTEPVGGLSPRENLVRGLDEAFKSIFVRFIGKAQDWKPNDLRDQLQNRLGPDLYNEAFTGAGERMPYYRLFYGLMWIDAEHYELIPQTGTRVEISGRVGLRGALCEAVVQSLNRLRRFFLRIMTPRARHLVDACDIALIGLGRPMTPHDHPQHRKAHTNLRNEPDTQDDIVVPKSKKPKTNAMNIGSLQNRIEDTPALPQVQIAPVEAQLNQGEPPQGRPSEYSYFLKLDLFQSLLKRVPEYSDTKHPAGNQDQPTLSQPDYEALLAEFLWWQTELARRETYISHRVIRRFLDIVTDNLGDPPQSPPGRSMREQAILALETLRFPLALKFYEQARRTAQRTSRGTKRPLSPPVQDL